MEIHLCVCMYSMHMHVNVCVYVYMPHILSIYIPWPFPPVWRVADNTKETTKNNRGFTPFFQQWRGIQPSLDGTAGATQPILPRLPQLTSLHRCRLPYCPYHRVASTRQPRGNSRCQSELRHNHSPLIPIPSTLTCLPYIHPPIIQGSLYFIHPPKPRPPCGVGHITKNSTNVFSACRKRRLKETGRGDWESPPL